CLGDVEDDAIAGLAVIKDEIGCRPRAIPFRVEIVAIHKRNETRGEEQQQHREYAAEPRRTYAGQSGGREYHKRRNTKDHVSRQENRTRKKKNQSKKDRKKQPEEQEADTPCLPVRSASRQAVPHRQEGKQAGDCIDQRQSVGEVAAEVPQIGEAWPRDPF